MKIHKSQVKRLQPHPERKYPGVGLLLCVGSGLLFWGSVAYIIVK
jgi:hypothetical protein